MPLQGFEPWTPWLRVNGFSFYISFFLCRVSFGCSCQKQSIFFYDQYSHPYYGVRFYKRFWSRPTDYKLDYVSLFCLFIFDSNHDNLSVKPFQRPFINIILNWLCFISDVCNSQSHPSRTFAFSTAPMPFPLYDAFVNNIPPIIRPESLCNLKRLIKIRSAATRLLQIDIHLFDNT